MTSHYEQLGISLDATPAEVKAAYHAKLREFPAHTYPEEFKAIRAAYEALKKGVSGQFEDLLKFRPLRADLDQDSLKQLRQQAMSELEVSFEDLLRLTF